MKSILSKIPAMVSLFILLIFPQLSFSQHISSSIEEGFRNPPESAKPRTWWHWTNSNITREGITKDLEWMKRSGIGGMQLADVAAGQGQVVQDKTTFMSPEWLDAVHHTAYEAERLDLEMTIFSSAGWSLTGGPWVKPGQAMKKLVWSETNLKGPLNFYGKLTEPPTCEGPIRDLSASAKSNANESGFYEDFLVLAFPTLNDETDETKNIPVVTTEEGEINAAALFDNELSTFVTIRSGKNSDMFGIQFNFEKPFTARAITIANRAGIPVGKLSASNDNVTFTTVAFLPGPQLYRAGKVETISFPAITAKFFRFEITGAPMRPADVMSETINPADTVYTFNEMKLHSGSRINRWEDKAGFYHLFNYDPVKTSETSPYSAIDHHSIIDLTSKLLPDGSIDWNVPDGNWTIMRFGYSLTGARNRPAVPSGSGYEVDKLSKEHTEAYIKEYTDPLSDVLGDLYGNRLQFVMLDSWEAGMQNWTENMLNEFKTRRGYDLTPFLPCLTGRIVDNSDISDRVLWDFRRTLADMFAENHYGAITEYLNRQGIKTYGEASGVSLEILEDALLCKKNVDIPMGEFWYRALHPELMYYQDIRGAASASHIYGKNLVAAEAFTGGSFESPFTLKKIADYWFTQGVNRLVFHTSAHQPLDTKPGNTMVGTHINRNITWAEQASPFMTYISRVSYMLQQGRSVADLLYLLDEGAPSTMPIWGTGLNPPPPEGYDYDYINADALLNRMTVSSDGKLVLPDGIQYSVLVLPESQSMTLRVMEKIKELVAAGATIVGPKPENTPGYTGYPESEDHMRDLASLLWADLDGISRTVRVYGKGMIYWGTPIETVLNKLQIRPDFEYSEALDSKINWVHRKYEDTDIYFVVNSTDVPVNTKIRFRVSGKEAELWDPSGGETKSTGFKIIDDMTEVPINFAERQSIFVVFRKNADANEIHYNQPSIELLAELRGPWKVNFPDNWGAPEKSTFTGLESWTVNADEGIKYFSGTAKYSKEIKVPGSWIRPGNKLLLDLGKVCDIAEVMVNGNHAGIIWHAPFQADITGMLRKGTNILEVKITNEWTNRLIGDLKAEPENKILNSQVFVFNRNPVESGLLGPVKIFKLNE